jgi:predicted phosphodiesterase
MLRQMRRILAEEGCDGIFLSGNHDPGWDSPGYLELADGRIVVTHGDALMRDGAPWKREMLAGQDIVDALWKSFPDAATDVKARFALARAMARRFPSLHHPDGRSVAARAIDAAFPPMRAIAMISAWIGQARLGARFCEAYFPKAELLVTGHFHCKGIRKSGGRTVINTGSFVVPGPAGWVEWDGAALSAGRVSESGESFSLAPGRTRLKFFRKH